MKILALELSSAQGSLALLEDHREIFESTFANDRKHSGLFFENLQRALQQHGNPDRIVVGLGPGSYAGTRIAIATALGLAASAKAELLGLPSLCAMRTKATEYCVIGDARRQTFYFARVRERHCLAGPELCTREELSERLNEIAIPVFATEPVAGFNGVEVAYPSAPVLARISKEGRSPGRPVSPLEPIYLSAPHITQPKPRSTFPTRA